jgi:hypothetical protein
MLTALQQEWYTKLRDSGFKDIELSWVDGKPKVRHIPHSERAPTKRTRTEQWTWCIQRYAHHQEKDAYKRKVLLLIAEGVHRTQVAKDLKTTTHKIRYIYETTIRTIEKDLMARELPSYLETNVDE